MQDGKLIRVNHKLTAKLLGGQRWLKLWLHTLLGDIYL